MKISERANSPAYELVDANYLNLNLFDDSFSFAPAFGDLDNDGDLDILVGEIYTSCSMPKHSRVGQYACLLPGSMDIWASISGS